MQLSAVLNIFIVKTLLNSIFTNDLKRKYFFFRKMFIVTDLVSLTFETPILKLALCPLNIHNFKFKWSIVLRQTENKPKKLL